MIIDLESFIRDERPSWDELDRFVTTLEEVPGTRYSLDQIRRFHYLYQKACADLARIQTFSAEQGMRQHLEALVARAYAEIYRARAGQRGLNPIKWFFNAFPQAFRRRIRAFHLALLVTLAGVIFGGGAIMLDPAAKEVLMPFPHLQGSPSERVAQEESGDIDSDRLSNAKASFSTYLMTHNIQVSVFAMALGMTFGIGTLVLLFYNGVILGAVAVDYILAGEGVFLAGWLLPHGAVEIPAILLGGQAGLVLASAIIGRDEPLPIGARLREASGDLVTLVIGLAVFLVWAGIIEAFLSQYHEPVLPYAVKIGFGCVELTLLILFLGWAGRRKTPAAKAPNAPPRTV